MQIKMRSILGFLILATAIPTLAETSAPITSVVLYPGSATIVRTAHIEAGATQLVVSGITASYEMDTLRVESAPGIRIGQVFTQVSWRAESTNPVEIDLEAKIQALKDKEAQLDAESASADVVKGFLDRLVGDATSSSERPRTPMDAKYLTGLIDVIGRGASDALGKKQRLAIQKRAILKSIHALQLDLQRLRDDAKDRRTVTVNLTAERAGYVRLTYQVNSAGWSPAYRAELSSASSTVSLERLAQISQKTEEDWKDVKVLLSTGQPRLSPAGPEPQPWLLTYVPPNQATEARGATTVYGVADLAFSSAAAPASPADERKRRDARAYLPPTFQTEGAFTTEFEVPIKVTLPGDGRMITLALAKQTVAVKQRLQVAPRIDKAATVRAEAERPAGVWLPGNMHLYRDGSYVGRAVWDPQASDRFAFSFGRDDLLLTTIDQVKGNTGSTGVFEKRNQRRMSDLITVRSKHTAPVDVFVIDASPVSTSSEIEVQAAFEPKPSIETWERRQGIVAWEKTLSPNEAARIGITYTIDYPKEGRVTGLR